MALALAVVVVLVLDDAVDGCWRNEVCCGNRSYCGGGLHSDDGKGYGLTLGQIWSLEIINGTYMVLGWN
jgi:hypothetical protein